MSRRQYDIASERNEFEVGTDAACYIKWHMLRDIDLGKWPKFTGLQQSRALPIFMVQKESLMT